MQGQIRCSIPHQSCIVTLWSMSMSLYFVGRAAILTIYADDRSFNCLIKTVNDLTIHLANILCS